MENTKANFDDLIAFRAYREDKVELSPSRESVAT